MTNSLEQTGNLRPTYPRDQAAVWREIRKLWAGVNSRDAGRVDDVPFVLAGSLYVSTSPRYYLRASSTLQRVLVSLDTPGTTATEIRLYRNGDVLAAVSLPAGVEKAQVALASAFEPDLDYLRVGVASAGSGAKDASVQCRFRSSG